MCAKLLMTVLVPAPEDPVTAMTGCLVDMNVLAGKLFVRRMSSRAIGPRVVSWRSAGTAIAR
jgi:hypothetical protein